MIDDDAPAPNNQARVIALSFVGLYLVVLAFFIFLVSISSPEQGRRSAVMDSLRSSFPAPLSGIMDGARSEDLADEQMQDVLQERIADLFVLLFPDARIKEDDKRQQVIVEVPEDQLYVAGTANLSPKGEQLAKEVARFMQPDRNNGARIFLEYRFAAPEIPGSDLRRAGSFARAIEAADMPKGMMSIGIDNDAKSPYFIVHIVDHGDLSYPDFHELLDKEGE